MTFTSYSIGFIFIGLVSSIFGIKAKQVEMGNFAGISYISQIGCSGVVIGIQCKHVTSVYIMYNDSMVCS